MARNSTLKQNQIGFCLNFHNFKIFYSDLFVTHMSWEFFVFKNTRGIGGRSNRSRFTMKHGPMSGIPTPKVMPFHDTGKTLSLAHTGNT